MAFKLAKNTIVRSIGAFAKSKIQQNTSKEMLNQVNSMINEKLMVDKDLYGKFMQELR